MAKKKAVKKTKNIEDEEDIKPDGYIGDISPAEYWEWRCACAEKMVEKEKYNYNSLMQRFISLEVENKKLQGKIFQMGVMANSKQAMENAERELQETRKKLGDVLGHPLEGCIINEAFQVLKPEESHGSA